MSSLILALFVVGLVLLGFEVIVPGAILGIAAGLCLFAGVALAFMEHGPMGGFLALGVAAAAVGALLFFEFWVLPRTRFGRRMFLQKAIDGTSHAPMTKVAADVVGQPAVALTPLGPTGVVEVAGRRYEARCASGFAETGARLRVTSLESFQLVVMAEPRS